LILLTGIEISKLDFENLISRYTAVNFPNGRILLSVIIELILWRYDVSREPVLTDIEGMKPTRTSHFAVNL